MQEYTEISMLGCFPQIFSPEIHENEIPWTPIIHLITTPYVA